MKTPRPPYVVTSPVPPSVPKSMGTAEVSMSSRFRQADTATDGTLLLHTHKHTPTRRSRLCLPLADAPACVVQGLMSRVRGVFPSLLPPCAGWLAAHHPTSLHQPYHHVCNQREKWEKSNPRSVTATNGAALHCIRSTSCHPSPSWAQGKARQGKGRRDTMRGTNFHRVKSHQAPSVSRSTRCVFVTSKSE